MIKQKLIEYTSLSDKDIDSLLGRAPTTYAIYYVPKRNGTGMRQICQPSVTTKMMQYCLMDFFFSNFAIHKKALAYHAGISSPLLRNANCHKDFKYSVHCDYKDFFPSIMPENLYDAINDFPLVSTKLGQEDKDVLKRVCFIFENNRFHLTIGAPTSPIISNIVMKKHDEYFDSFANNKNDSYTRYADDLWYSSNEETHCSVFIEEVRSYLQTHLNRQLILNEAKTRFYKPGQPRFITGLVVANNSVMVPRKIKRYVRSLINEDFLSEKQLISLKGYISYIRANEPHYINSLVMKYNEKFFKKLS
jgi:RNA-directed DNA polymerase